MLWYSIKTTTTIPLHRQASLNHSNSNINTLRLRQNGHHFPDDIFKWIFLNEKVWISMKISLKFVPKGPINNIPALVQIRAWRRPRDKPLSEPMMVSLLTHICVTRPQWVKTTATLPLLRQLLLDIQLLLIIRYLTEAGWRVYTSMNWVIIGSGCGLSSDRLQTIILMA